MNEDQLLRTARAMVAPGKGIFAADESAGTIAKRFAAIGVDSTQVTRATTANSCSAPKTASIDVFQASSL